MRSLRFPPSVPPTLIFVNILWTGMVIYGKDQSTSFTFDGDTISAASPCTNGSTISQGGNFVEDTIITYLPNLRVDKTEGGSGTESPDNNQVAQELDLGAGRVLLNKEGSRRLISDWNMDLDHGINKIILDTPDKYQQSSNHRSSEGSLEGLGERVTQFVISPLSDNLKQSNHLSTQNINSQTTPLTTSQAPSVNTYPSPALPIIESFIQEEDAERYSALMATPIPALSPSALKQRFTAAKGQRFASNHHRRLPKPTKVVANGDKSDNTKFVGEGGNLVEVGEKRERREEWDPRGRSNRIVRIWDRDAPESLMPPTEVRAKFISGDDEGDNDYMVVALPNPVPIVHEAANGQPRSRAINYRDPEGSEASVIYPEHKFYSDEYDGTGGEEYPLTYAFYKYYNPYDFGTREVNVHYNSINKHPDSLDEFDNGAFQHSAKEPIDLFRDDNGGAASDLLTHNRTTTTNTSHPPSQQPKGSSGFTTKGKRNSGHNVELGGIEVLAKTGGIFAKQKLLLQTLQQHAAFKHPNQLVVKAPPPTNVLIPNSIGPVRNETDRLLPPSTIDKGNLTLAANSTVATSGRPYITTADVSIDKTLSNLTLVNSTVTHKNVTLVGVNYTNTSTTPSVEGSILDPETGSQKFCVTKECVEIAASLFSSMDASIDPCQNFYEYACKKRDKEHVIPEGEVKVNRFTELIHNLNVKVKGILEETIDESKEPGSVMEAKYFYRSCVNESFIENAKTEPLLKFLQKYGGWPVLEATWDEDRFSVIDVIADLRKYRIQVLIKEDLNPDKRNSSIYIIEVDQPKFRFQREAYIKGPEDETMTKYWLFMVNVAEYLGAERQVAEAEMMEVLKFEIQLANISLPMKARIYMTNFYKKMNIEELSNQIPEIDWLKYFSHLMPTINKEDLVGVMSLDYLKKLGKVLTLTPKRILANFIMWKTVQTLIQYTNRDLVDLEKMFNKMVGSGTDRSRWKICVYNTLKFFPLVNGNLFIKKYFSIEVKESVFNMSKEIKDVFNERLPQIEWMDNQTRIAAQKKADFIIKKIAYPSILLDEAYLKNLSKKVTIKKETYFENILNLEKKVSEVEHTYFRKYVNRTEWKERILEVNAYYHWNKNYIIIPAGILQPPFFKIGYPKSVNYARIGFIIGHETTHAFDSLGSQYNEFGNQKEWWSKDITQKFKEKASCIIEQYGNYTVPEVGLNLNGDASQSENIADNGGIKQAYVAYKNAEKKYGEDFLLPGLDLNHDQIFFLSFAQIWCGLTRKEKIITDIQTLSHPFEKFRVIGTLSNFPRFAEAYKCPLGTPMNPYKKCSVW